MPSELKPSPKSGALPCDWVDNPREPATPADDALVEELAVALDEACVVYQQAFKDGFNPSRWDVPSADMARAILPILHRREQARYFEGLDTGSSQGYDEGREAENERLRQEVQDLTDELAYHGVYPK